MCDYAETSGWNDNTYYCFGISCAEKRSWTEVTFEHDSYIKVPLTINGDVHWYIFDTGAGVSTILSELAVKYNLRNEREEELAENRARN